MERRSYKNPPIQEVVFEIILDPATPWDLAVPGILYEQMKKEFPTREKRLVQQVEIQQSTGGSGLNVTQNERAVFLTQDGRRLIQVGERLLAVNQLPPYPGWTGFRRSIEVAYQALNNVVGAQELRRLSLRYIDRIEIPDTEIHVEEYFRLRPHFEGVEKGSTLDTWASFIVGIQIPYEGQRDVLRIEMGPEPSRKDKLTYILKTEYRLAQLGRISPDRVLEWLDVAHNRVVEAFETAITDKLRMLFQPM